MKDNKNRLFEMMNKVSGMKPNEESNTDGKSKYLIALPSFPGGKGFNHQTILVSGKDENDAIALAKHLKPQSNIGDIKKVDY
jgi:hypothetical protein